MENNANTREDLNADDHSSNTSGTTEDTATAESATSVESDTEDGTRGDVESPPATGNDDTLLGQTHEDTENADGGSQSTENHPRNTFFMTSKLVARVLSYLRRARGRLSTGFGKNSSDIPSVSRTDTNIDITTVSGKNARDRLPTVSYKNGDDVTIDQKRSTRNDVFKDLSVNTKDRPIIVVSDDTTQDRLIGRVTPDGTFKPPTPFRKPVNNEQDMTGHTRLSSRPARVSLSISLRSSRSFIYSSFRIMFSNMLVFMMSTFGLVLSVVAYCTFGAWLFLQLEGNGKSYDQSSDETHMSFEEQTLQEMWYLVEELRRNGSLQEDAWMRSANKLLIGIMKTHNCVDNTIVWTFARALLFAVNVVTTIGYGNFTPVTKGGRLACILYGFIGVPLTMMCLANIGACMAHFMRGLYPWSAALCTRCKKGKGKGNKGEGTGTDKGISKRKERGEDEDMEEVPIPVCLLIILGYFFIGAFLFNRTEGWTYLDAVYFCFATLTTIGFGDIVPGFAKAAPSSWRQIICIFYILLGLALLAMCFELMGNHTKNACRRLWQFAGLIPEQPPTKRTTCRRRTRKRPVFDDLDYSD